MPDNIETPEKTNKKIYSDVTLLITHFNRSTSLRRLLARFDELGFAFGEVVVADGGSKPDHLETVFELEKKHKFKLLTTDVNYGLGHTINSGQNAATKPYILYVQEDFVPKPAFVSALTDGLEIMEQEKTWDIVRFYSFPWAKFPYLKKYKKGFSEMRFSLSPIYTNHHKFYMYSDHPHLKRKTYPEKFGNYVESIHGDVTEMAMCKTFLKKQGKGLYFDDYTALFDHINSEDEPGLFRPINEKNKKYRHNPLLYKPYLKYKTFRETVRYLLDI
ncbi:MAG: glycosyltransferase [Sphingobacteriaceae bacterium]|nr:MAG: glycosyltransferase [Sphingobacteriaceae bacterium]